MLRLYSHDMVTLGSDLVYEVLKVRADHATMELPLAVSILGDAAYTAENLEQSRKLADLELQLVDVTRTEALRYSQMVRTYHELVMASYKKSYVEIRMENEIHHRVLRALGGIL
jgi:hypothetical protein